MARDRQRAKRRQAERRAARLEERSSTAGSPRRSAEPREQVTDEELRDEVLRDEALTDGDLHDLADLEVGAPSEDIGRPDTVLRHPQPPPPDFEIDDEELADEADGAAPAPAGPRGVRGARAEAEPHRRGRLVAFLIAVWAELNRVQWPDRKQLTQLTGVVLFFVLVVGAYLGGLDAVFSKLIEQIL
jgi:preprotein translocase subunit SecE